MKCSHCGGTIIQKYDKVSKYLELFAKAIGMGDTVPPLPSPKERSRYELETHQSLLAGDGGREMDSASKEPSEEEEAPTTESETKPLGIHEQYHNDTSKHKDSGYKLHRRNQCTRGTRGSPPLNLKPS